MIRLEIIRLVFPAVLIRHQLLLILDLQEGLYNLARDFDATLYRDSIIAHAAIGQVFDIPVIMTTSAQQGLSPLPIQSASRVWA